MLGLQKFLKVVIALAVWIGKERLIDNVVMELKLFSPVSTNIRSNLSQLLFSFSRLRFCLYKFRSLLKNPTISDYTDKRQDYTD